MVTKIKSRADFLDFIEGTKVGKKVFLMANKNPYVSEGVLNILDMSN